MGLRPVWAWGVCPPRKTLVRALVHFPHVLYRESRRINSVRGPHGTRSRENTRHLRSVPTTAVGCFVGLSFYYYYS